MRVEIDAEALAEAIEAKDYYAVIAPSLGDHFALAFDHAIESILSTPLMWPPYTARTRRYVMSRFPYVVIYRMDGELIRVLALAHQRRRTGYWRGR